MVARVLHCEHVNGSACDIAADQLLIHGILEGRPEHPEYLLNRAGRQGILAALCG